MKPGLGAGLLLSVVVAITAGYALYASMSWPFQAALFPRVLAAPLLILAVLEVTLSLFVVERRREGHAVDFEFTRDVEPRIGRQRTLSIFAWILGFLGLILTIGFPLAVPLFVFCYLKLVGKEGWVLTFGLTALGWLLMEGLFDWFLHIPFPKGWLL